VLPLLSCYLLPFQERFIETAQVKPSDVKKAGIVSVLAGNHQSAKVVFDDSRMAEFKYVWVNFLRFRAVASLAVSFELIQSNPFRGGGGTSLIMIIII